jgi:hypothetical protein
VPHHSLDTWSVPHYAYMIVSYCTLLPLAALTVGASVTSFVKKAEPK